MDEVFADSGYWIARACLDDPLHDKANYVAERIGSRRIVTSEMVLAEFLNFMAKHGPYYRMLAVATTREVQNSRAVEIVPHTTEQFWRALDIYELHSDLRWGLVDRISFEIMRGKKILDALAHDRDFQQAGFRALLRES